MRGPFFDVLLRRDGGDIHGKHQRGRDVTLELDASSSLFRDAAVNRRRMRFHFHGREHLEMRKPTSLMVSITLAAMFFALPLCATAEDGRGQGQPAAKKRVGPHVEGVRPGQGPRRVGPHPEGARFAHRHIPGRHFGGRPYYGRHAWGGGRWRHEWHNGRYGWWWDVGGAWYFYPERMDGPPTYVSEIEFMEGPGPDGPVGEGYPPPEAVVGDYPPEYAPPPPPPPPPAPSSTVGGAIGGAILGGVIGGAVTGRAGGAAVGALIGGTTGAAIGSEAERRRGYYWWRGGCYYRYPSGEYAVVAPGYCG